MPEKQDNMFDGQEKMLVNITITYQYTQKLIVQCDVCGMYRNAKITDCPICKYGIIDLSKHKMY